jgi:hypothetical protein
MGPEMRVRLNKHRPTSQATCPTVYKGNIAERKVSQCYEVRLNVVAVDDLVIAIERDRKVSSAKLDAPPAGGVEILGKTQIKMGRLFECLG